MIAGRLEVSATIRAFSESSAFSISNSVAVMISPHS